MHIRGVYKYVLLVVFLVVAGPACKLTVDANQAELTKKIELEYWRPFDGTDAFDSIITKYNAIHPNVRIQYRQIRPEIYEKELLNAFAEDRGPDMFSIHNTWMRGYKSKIEPMPDSYQISTIIPTGSLDGKTKVSVVDKRGLTPRQLQSQFVDVALDAMVLPEDGLTSRGDLVNDNVWGVPLAVDSMMLFYNKDLLQTAGIAQPPTTWVEFMQQVQDVTVIDENFKLERAGAVIGTSTNVPRSSDLLSLIMMQAGAQMVNDDGYVTFHENPPGFNRATPPGIDALRFYIDFALPVRNVYTWNSLQPNGLEAFIRGEAAFMFGYSYQLPLIRARAPKLALGVAPVPQQVPAEPVNIANFWLETVSRKSEYTDWAWDFLLFESSAEHVQDYLEATQKPTALRSLIEKQREDLYLGPFVDQLLTSRMWYRGYDGLVADSIMETMITRVTQAIVAGDDQAFSDAIKGAVSQLNQTMRSKN